MTEQDAADARATTRAGDDMATEAQHAHPPRRNAMNAPASPLLHIPAIGSLLAGGIVLGHVFVDSNPYSLIVPRKTVREPSPARMPWSNSLQRVSGAQSAFDGLANTRAMAEAGSDLAKWALAQRIEGFDDWHIGSRQDLLVIGNSLAAAGPLFAPAGSEAFEEAWYWTSTQDELDDDWAWMQPFGDGNQSCVHKSLERRAFVLRREPIR